MGANTKVTRAEKFLELLTQNGLISEMGKEWLINIVDPFHDKPINPSSWPDMETGRSVTRSIKKGFEIKKPPSMPSGNWDLIIVMWPFLNNYEISFQRCTLEANTIDYGPMTAPPGPPLPTTNPKFALGGIQCFAVPSGKSFDYTCDPSKPADERTVFVGAINFGGTSDSLDADPGRLVHIAFETHNTTAELYKQGNVTYFKMMQASGQLITYNPILGLVAQKASYDGPVSGFPVLAPPNNLTGVLELGTSWTQEAKYGGYTVGTFYDMENPPYLTQPIVPAVFFDDVVPPSGTKQLMDIAFLSPVQEKAGKLLFPNGRIHKIHTSGQMYSGLSDSTTIQLNAKFGWESFPNQTNLKDVTVARASNDLDFNALRFYSEIMKDMPVGVGVAENGLGDWFMEAAATAAQAIGPMIGGSAGKMISALGNMGMRHLPKDLQQNTAQVGNVHQRPPNKSLTQAQNQQKKPPQKPVPQNQPPSSAAKNKKKKNKKKQA